MSRLISAARKEIAFSALIIFLLLRSFLILISIRFPEGAALVDSRAYMAFASTIIQGGTYTDLNSPPGFPFFIALASGWTTPGFVSTTLAQLILTSTTAIMLVSIGSRMTSKKAGLVAGWLYAVSPNTALWALTVMSETLYASLLVGSIWLWLIAKDESNPVNYAVLGILLGCGAMVRNIGLIVIPLWVGINLIRVALRKQYVQAMTTSLAIALGSAIMLIPWGVHNYLVHGEFTITEEHGRTFYVFNVAAVLAEVENVSRDQAAARMATAVDPFGITVGLLKEHPMIFFGEQGKGILRSMFGVSSGAWARVFGYPLEMQGSFELRSDLIKGNLSTVFERLSDLARSSEMIFLLALSILAFGHAVLLYGLSTGVFFVRRFDSWTLIVLLSTIALLLLSPGSVGQARFRIPVEPYITLLAGFGWETYQSRYVARKYPKDSHEIP